MVVNSGAEEVEGSENRPDWATDDTLFDKPSAARMYDYYLGGHHNFEIDRRMAQQAVSEWPDLPLIMQTNRAFLRRAVQFLLAQGIDQFLDVGSGIPTIGNVHEVVQKENRDARVVYVDIDPITVAHSEAILKSNPTVGVIEGDICDSLRIVNHPKVRQLLDFEKPVAILAVAVLHFVVDDEDIRNSMRTLRESLSSGSYLAVSHASFEAKPQETREHEVLYRQTSTPIKMRSYGDILQFFEGFDLVDPGLVYFPLWRPEGPNDLFLDEPERSPGFAGVGLKTSPSATQ